MNSMVFAHTLSDKVSNYYSGRQAVLVVEESEESIARLLESEVGLQVLTVSIQETTSSTESPEYLPAQYMSREKAKHIAKQAMSQTNVSIGIAGLAYKGRDSVAPFLDAHSQSLIFLDKALNIEIFERSLSNQTSMISNSRHKNSKNPIHNLFRQLSVRLNQECPECSMPGWGITFEKQGLKCSACGLATREVQSHIWSCTVCRHSEEIERYNGLKRAHPEQCSSCSS